MLLSRMMLSRMMLSRMLSDGSCRLDVAGGRKWAGAAPSLPDAQGRWWSPPRPEIRPRFSCSSWGRVCGRREPSHWRGAAGTDRADKRIGCATVHTCICRRRGGVGYDDASAAALLARRLDRLVRLSLGPRTARCSLTRLSNRGASSVLLTYRTRSSGNIQRELVVACSRGKV